MPYKTIVLELLEQRPAMYARLRQERMVLATLDLYSAELKTRHESWMDHLRQARPDSDESQIAGEALEIALAELEEHLLTESPTADADT